MESFEDEGARAQMLEQDVSVAGARAQMLEQDVSVAGAFSFCSSEELEWNKIGEA
jgi:hypothetical protein